MLSPPINSCHFYCITSTLDLEHEFIIEEIYSLAQERSKYLGIKYEVDHIIPLQGKNVSGLHVPSNLQIITQFENRSKQNSYIT